MVVLFETERLVIRQWQRKDYKDMFEYASDEKLTKFLHRKAYRTLQQAKDRIDSIIKNYKIEPRYGRFAIALKDSDKVIGNLRLEMESERAGGIMSVGWTLNREYQGKGYMTEAVVAMFKYIKANNLAKRITATCDVDNVKSGAVMKRVGMTFEGISRKAGDNNFHSRHDVANYSILYEEIK